MAKIIDLTKLNQTLQGYSEEEAVKLLNKEGRRLKYIALKILRKYYSSYRPKRYIRTKKSLRGIKLEKVERVDANTFGIKVTFENDLMYHDSVIKSGNQPKGHSVMLISDGWHSRKLENKGRRIYRFTYFEGINYIGQIQKEYNNGKPAGVTLEVQWSGKYLK